jgi:hypothetical protein
MDKFKFERQLLVAISQIDLHIFMEIRKLILQMKFADVRINMHSLLRMQFINFDKGTY